MSTATTNIETVKLLVPELRFKEFEEEWTKKDFGSIVDKAKAKHDPKKSKEEYPCIEMESITKESSILLEIFNSKDQLSIKNKFNKGEVLFGKLRPNLKKYIIAPFDGVCSSEIWVLKGKKLSNEFLFRLIQTNKFYSSTLVTSGSKMPRADWAYISSSIFPFPSLPEQQKIASFLSAVDEKIQQLTKKKALLEVYKKGVMQQLFSGQLRFKDGNGKDYPGWEEERLGEVCQVVTGKTPSTSDESLWSGVIQFITPTDIEDGQKYQNKTKRTVKQTEKLFILPSASIIYTCIASIGKMVLSVKPCITNQQINSLIPNEKCVNEYIYYWMLKITPKIKSTQSTTTLPIINKTDFSKFKVNLPSLQEQQKIATYLSDIDTKIESVNNKITQTQTFKKGLLQQLFV
jgi:type I restriction enzyme S subunit